MSEDVEFRGATVYDGSGGPATEASVRVVDGRIERVSSEATGAERVVDVDGAALTPGFVDMHAHSELRLLDQPEAVEKVTQGVTLEVLGPRLGNSFLRSLTGQRAVGDDIEQWFPVQS